jgi:hypothetical protein
MRIAISGTHYMGKSTMIHDFIKSRPEYHQEIEASFRLQEEDGTEFPAAPILECILMELDYTIERLNQCAGMTNSMFDRCPVDYIAYAMYIAQQDQLDINDNEIADRFPLIKMALRNLDLIVFIPITKKHLINDIEDEDFIFRKVVDSCFKKLYRDEIYDLFPGYQQPKIIELWGNRQERIKKLETYL